MTNRSRRDIRTSAVALVLVVVMLLGSVLIPARQTWRILGSLRDIESIADPARRLAVHLQAGIDVEAATLQGYAFSGDTSLLAQLRATTREDDERLGQLARLTSQLSDSATLQVTAVREQLGEWRRHNLPLAHAEPLREPLPSAIQREHVGRDSVVAHVGRLVAYLDGEAVRRSERIRELEEDSLIANASLVFLALAAVLAVAGLVHRERRLTATLQRRMQSEAALREAAEVLAGAFTMSEVTECIPRWAVAVTGARGAFVECLVPGAGSMPDAVSVQAASGSGVPTLDSTAPLHDSYTELALRQGEPLLVPNFVVGHRWSATSAASGARSDTASAIVVPIVNEAAPIGALFIIGAAGHRFEADDLGPARTFGHIVALAYEKVRLLDEAHEGHKALERVMNSRSRLMRGFSHDVKNPLGAADGYAELLANDIYGPLSTEQRESVGRIRRAIRSALTLIDDLHELARAEGGHLTLALRRVDIRDLLSVASDEYRAAAKARGLRLSLELPSEPLVATTDETRVRQVVGNLLSNAIKYTSNGSVLLHAGVRVRGPNGDPGRWMAVAVTDTGSGIPLEKSQAIFEEFVRLGGPDRPGAGLGLAISQRLANALGGCISVQSDVGHGSTFTCWLPMDGPAQMDAAAVAPDAARERAEALTGASMVPNGSTAAPHMPSR